MVNIGRCTLAMLAITLAGISCRRSGAALATQELVSYDVGARPRAIAIADLNADGRSDVAVANAGDGTVSILLGTGGGKLGPAPASPVMAGQEPSDVEAADLDRDGDVDLVFANHETYAVTVLLNNGRASFTPAPGSPFETGARPHVHGLATGDFDGDGWLDVAVESSDTKEVRVLRGGSTGLGAAVGVSVGTMPYYRLGAANISGDEQPDIILPGHGDSTVRVVRREAANLVLAPLAIRLHDKPWMVVADDLNGDRRQDIVVVHSDAVSVWLAEREGFSQAQASPFAIEGATEVATGDLNNDGMADVAIGAWDGELVTVLLTPKLAQRTLRTCERSIGLAIGDLDGDRRNELLATCATQNRVVVVIPPFGR
ncbi:MAG: FG-GAP repeat domain-containing protein [Gemmatimonadaceae bacterium]